MKMTSSGSAVAGLTKELSRSWDDKKTSWRDQKALEFEQRYLNKLFDSVDSAMAVIDKLDKAVEQVRRDCE